MESQLETAPRGVPGEETYCGETLANMEELKRLISMEVRLTGMLLGRAITVEQYHTVYAGYETRILSTLELKEMHLKRFSEDLEGLRRRLRDVEEEKELLEARREIGDIAEDSYALKRRAVDWDMARLQAGVDRDLRCIGTIEALPGQVDPGDVSAIEAYMADGMAAVKDAGLDGETEKRLRARVKRLAQLVGAA